MLSLRVSSSVLRVLGVVLLFLGIVWFLSGVFGQSRLVFNPVTKAFEQVAPDSLLRGVVALGVGLVVFWMGSLGAHLARALPVPGVMPALAGNGETTEDAVWNEVT